MGSGGLAWRGGPVRRPRSGERRRRASAIKGDMGRQRPDRFQILLGVWVVVGLLVLAVVVVRSLP